MNSGFGRRLLAYIVDTFILAILLLIAMAFVPANATATDYNNRLTNITSDFTSNQISINEYYEEYQEISFGLVKEEMLISIIQVVLIIVYYCIIPFYMNGQTFGKKLLKIRVIKDSGKLTMNDFIIRTVINEGLLTLLVSLGLAYLVSASTYNTAVSSLNVIQTGLVIASVFMILFRKDKCGVQDIVTKTRVVRED